MRIKGSIGNRNKEQVPVYKFLKEAIIRRFGEDFYEELDAAAQYLKENKS